MVEFNCSPLSRYQPLPNALSPEQEAALKTLQEQFSITDETTAKIVDGLNNAMDHGLKGTGEGLLMEPSYVTGRSTGQEQGNYLALDFGGSNLRVCLVNLQGKHIVSMEQGKHKFSDSIKKEKGVVLFGQIADFIDTFLTEQRQIGNLPKSQETALNLGFTFSFPMLQQHLASGVLVRWTKGFENFDVHGKDVVQMLQKELDDRGIWVKVNAIVNDTVGTLAASGYANPSSQVGLILGTGTNAAYYELTENITKLKPEVINASKEMIINMEWGAFDDNKKILPLTEFDNKMDSLTWNPNQQIFEKTISGYYLGEIFRLIIKKYIDQGIIFNGKSSNQFDTFEGVDTAFLSQILDDGSSELKAVGEVLDKSLGIPQTTLADRIFAKKVTDLIGFRAAKLAGIGIAVVLLRRKDLLDKPVTVGVDGSLYEFFPFFQAWMNGSTRKLLGPEYSKNVKFTLSKDGSGIGAALASMTATNIKV